MIDDSEATCKLGSMRYGALSVVLLAGGLSFAAALGCSSEDAGTTAGDSGPTATEAGDDARDDTAREDAAGNDAGDDAAREDAGLDASEDADDGGTGGDASDGEVTPPGFPWGGAIDPNGDPSSAREVARPLGSTSAPQGFYEYTPAGYPGSAKWPLLIALHGVGENGNGASELDELRDTGLGHLIGRDKWPNDRPFVVLRPQHAGGGCPSSSEIHAFITWGLENYAIDPHYVYLTGLSCGAIGSWSYLANHLDAQIAAFVSIAGNGKSAWNSKGCDLGKVAIWAFHGDADPTVDVSGTNVPLDGLAGCPAPPALESKKTIYPGVGHDSWSRTYDGSAGHDVFSWMLGFKRP